MRPRSRGTVEIVSADPSVLPRITFDPLADEEDVRKQIELLRFVRKLAATPPLCDLIVTETRPGASFETDGQLRDAILQFGAASYHAAGTCRMGNDDDSVVDALARVRGVDGLHVVDLSIAPFLLSGNTFAPVAALAWRATELLRRC
ncbi:hypothetical protein D0Z70_06620 [Sphingobium terrigena]|uniref:Glucose-methanol-choline oxidoreductase C-terminal domain-containing protein n=1 Tax=Sphingobium terrigena TaxID=2304063 RepID=A0A418YVQ7_9SPHN|nr:GMC family oxidoreductase [Sphingobium terrigena]RJG56311.1 hypothetical protein D0Z70_06620 [Sphingobium terrigena]